jgi:hypothetical protein
VHDCTLYARYALLTGEKRFWDAVVALPSVLFCVSREKFLPLLEQWPEYIDHFLEVCPTAGDTRLQSPHDTRTPCGVQQVANSRRQKAAAESNQRIAEAVRFSSILVESLFV